MVKEKICRDSGHSLMELVVAMGLSIIVISGVYFVWNYITIHVTKQSIASTLQKENNRLLHLIASQVQHSPAILFHDQKSICFISEKTDDTLKYEFDMDSLRVNSTPVTILLNRCTVSEFKLEDLSDDPSSGSKYTFIKMTLAMQHESGANDTSSLMIRTNRIELNQSDDYFK